MTIAIIPMLIEALPLVTGAIAGAAACALIYLKYKKASAESTNQSNQTQTDVSTATPPKQDSPEPVISSVAETIAKEVSQVIEIAKKSTTETFEEEPMLRRHHLHNIRLMLEATTFPRPTDSVLSRHYDEMIEAKAEDCLENEAKMARLIADYEAYQNAQGMAETQDTDEEPMLKRHYLHNLRMMVVATTFPRPTDSVLSRHYDEMIDAKAEDCLANEAKMARLIADYEEYERMQLC